VVEGLRPALLQVVPFAIALPLILIVARKRGFSLRDDLCLVWPNPVQAAVWIAVWILWLALSEWALRVFGEPAPEVREGLAPLVVVLKVVGMVVLAPAVEEIAFRGLLFRLVERTRLGANGAVILAALVFAALHVQYFGLGLLQVFTDGVLFGLARKTSRSVPLCIAMHSLGNAYAAYQRFHG
jgi:membrane protease YdiL (CAAX protease family)